MTIFSDLSIPELGLLNAGEAVLLDAEDLFLLDAGEPVLLDAEDLVLTRKTSLFLTLDSP